MIYLDTSVALAHLLAEDRAPPEQIWQESLVTSRLLEYEMWVRIADRDLVRSHGEQVRSLLSRLAFLEMVGPVLKRATEGFPVPLRTLDALHLASMDFLRRQGARPRLASYDQRLIEAARALEFPIHPV